MADSTRNNWRTSSSPTVPTWTDSVILTSITSNAQTSNASSSDNVQVFSDDSRSRSNTPSSFASNNAATSPESNFGYPKTDPNPSKLLTGRSQLPAAVGDIPQTRHTRTDSHGSERSAPSPQVLESHADAINSSHHASQTLETIPQAALPPPLVEPAEDLDNLLTANSSALEQSQRSGDQNDRDQEDRVDDGSARSSPEAPARSDSWWSAPLFWTEVGRRKLHKSSAGQKLFGVVSLTLTIIGTVLISYRSYNVQLWQAIENYYSYCQSIKPGAGDYDACQAQLKIPLEPPPYMPKRQVPEGIHDRRDLDMRVKAVQSRNTDLQAIMFFTLLGSALAFLVYTYVMWLCSRPSRQQGSGASSWRARRLWPINRQHSDHFSPVNVRIAPLYHQTNRPPALESDASTLVTRGLEHAPTLPNHLRQKRQIHILSGGIPHSDGVRRNSLHIDESLTQRPRWKRDSLPRSESVSLKGPNDTSTIHSELSEMEKEKLEAEVVQIGDALKGYAENDLILKRTTSSPASNTSYIAELRRKLHTRYPKLPYFLPGGDDSSDDDPIMTALGADPYDSFNPEDSDDAHIVRQRKNVVLSGFVAIAMAQAGSALASTAGGAIGRNILVQHVEDEAEEIYGFITTGKKMRATALAKYEEERDRFLSGEGLSRRTVRWESADVE